MIQALSKGEEITQEQLDTLFADYEALSDSDKEKVEDHAILEKYKGVNIDTVKELQGKVDNINNETTLRSIMETKNAYLFEVISG